MSPTPPAPPVRVALGEPNRLVRESLVAWLAAEPGIDIACIASSMAALRASIAADAPDVALLGFELSEGDIVACTRFLHPTPVIIIAPTASACTLREEVLASGASRVIALDEIETKLRPAIEQCS